MSDEQRVTLTTARVLYEHWCEEDGCKEWGGLGFRISNGEEPRWWCSEHFPYKRTNEKSRPTG